MQDVITHPCPNFSGYLAKLGHEVVLIYGNFINYPCPKSKNENVEISCIIRNVFRSDLAVW